MTIFLYARYTPTTKSFRKTKNKGIDKSSPDKRKAKESVVILISHKVEFNPQSVKHGKEGQLCTKWHSSHIFEARTKRIQGVIDRHSLIIGDFNKPFQCNTNQVENSMDGDRMYILIRKQTDKTGILIICWTLHHDNSVHDTITNTNHLSDHKQYLSKFHKMWLSRATFWLKIQSQLADVNKNKNRSQQRKDC